MYIVLFVIVRNVQRTGTFIDGDAIIKYYNFRIWKIQILFVVFMQKILSEYETTVITNLFFT